MLAIRKYSIICATLTLMLMITPTASAAGNKETKGDPCLNSSGALYDICQKIQRIDEIVNQELLLNQKEIAALKQINAQILEKLAEYELALQKHNADNIEQLLKLKTQADAQNDLGWLQWFILNYILNNFDIAIPVSAGVAKDALSDSTLQSQALQLKELVKCSKDVDGDGIPDNFDQCTCGNSSPPSCGGVCPDGNACVPVPAGDVGACACVPF